MSDRPDSVRGQKISEKERLWPFLDEFVDKTIKFIRREKDLPDLVHGHYPDAGYVARELAAFFGIPFVYTGHSLGRSKRPGFWMTAWIWTR